MTVISSSPNERPLDHRGSRVRCASGRAMLLQRWLVALGLLAWIATLGHGAMASSYGDWRMWDEQDGGFTLLVPPTHDLANSGSIWYVHGYQGGEPLVPDMSIEFRPGASLEAALAELGDDVLVEWVRLGVDTPARRITARHDGIEGPYVSSWYLVPATDGVFVVRGWENLYWELFHHVAVTFTLVDR